MITELYKNATELTPDYFNSVTSCLVLAPHPDDESLGCGGLIALLREKGKDVYVIFITDGSLSHPRSKQYPEEKLIALRKEEALQALAVLGVKESDVYFLNKKDGALPTKGDNHFEQNANQLHLLIAILHPDLILVPYEKDPHPDHRATWQMLLHPGTTIHASFRVLDYLIWLHERGEEADMPPASAVRYVNISPYLHLKKEAIEKHVSQTTTLIDDDPEGFILSPEVLLHFITNKEYYIERAL